MYSIIKGPKREFTSLKLHKIFEKNILDYEFETALIFNEDFKNSSNRTSYKKMNQSANKIARTIIDISTKNGSKPNSDGDWIVAVCMQPSDQLVTILLSIWKSGAAYLPLDPTFPKNRIQETLEDSKPFLVIHDNSFDTDYFGRTMSQNIDEISNKSNKFKDNNILDSEILGSPDNDLGIVLYTSGSTGKPRGVRLSHTSILNRLQWQWETFPYSRTEKVGVFKTALTFVDSVSEIWGPLLNGLSILIITKEITKNLEHLVRNLEDYQIERLVLVPTLLRALLMYLSMNKDQRLLFNLKSWICSGEPLAISLAEDFFDYFQEGVHVLYNFYGSTEVMGDVTYFVCENKNQLENFDQVPIGYPINNTVIYLLDSNCRPVKSGEVGEIFVSGLNLSSGYVNNKNVKQFYLNPLARDPIHSRVYQTGDFGFLQQGMIVCEGRRDSQIKIRGHRINLSEVENYLLSLDFIDKGIVLCYHPGKDDQAIVAFATLNDTSYNDHEIETMLKNELPLYMTPQVVIMDSIPLLSNEKIDRETLLKSYEETRNNDYDYNGVPEDLKIMAKDLFEIIDKIIGRLPGTKLSLASNFYELGGNSLNSIVTVTELRQKGYFIEISDFITAKNLGEILDLVKGQPLIMNEALNTICQDMTVRPLVLSDKDVVNELMATSFYTKGDLDKWLQPEITKQDYLDMLEGIWEFIVQRELSFLVENSSNVVVGVAVNYDMRDVPDMGHIEDNKFKKLVKFLDFIEAPIMSNKNIPKGLNKILHSTAMGTAENLNAQQNIAVIYLMEQETIKLAKRKNFIGIFATNSNHLTQQLATNIFKYKTMIDYQVNQYVDENGERIFGAAPDSQHVNVHWKDLKLDTN